MPDDDDVVGKRPLIEIINSQKANIAPFRLARFEKEYAAYEAGTPIDQEFILRCGSDLLDNPA